MTASMYIVLIRVYSTECVLAYNCTVVAAIVWKALYCRSANASQATAINYYYYLFLSLVFYFLTCKNVPWPLTRNLKFIMNYNWSEIQYLNVVERNSHTCTGYTTEYDLICYIRTFVLVPQTNDTSSKSQAWNCFICCVLTSCTLKYKHLKQCDKVSFCELQLRAWIGMVYVVAINM